MCINFSLNLKNRKNHPKTNVDFWNSWLFFKKPSDLDVFRGIEKLTLEKCFCRFNLAIVRF